MKRTIIRSLCVLWLFACLSAFGAETESPAQRDARMAWWRAARFGMFIHWGPVTLTGKELSWSRANSNPKCPNKGKTPVEVYDNLYKRFNPTNFHAIDWADTAKKSGMKYLVFTAKHCDGFLFWDSRVDGYNIMATPFKRDVCAELARAVRRDHLGLGWYFSPMDWRDPDFRTARNAAFIPRMQGELTELLSHYGPMDIMWFDWDGREAMYDQANTYAIVKRLQPRCIINNRLDLDVHDNAKMMKGPQADYYTPERKLGDYDDQRPWESCITLGTQWSWKPDDKIKSAAEVLNLLARTVGADGNLLLDIGPMPDGRIEPRELTVLAQVGAWMRRHGESIYGTRGGPWTPTPSVASTRKGNTIYLHVLKWPDGPLIVPDIPATILRAEVLGGLPAQIHHAGGGLEIFVPRDRDPLDTVIKLTLNSDAQAVPVIHLPTPPSERIQ